MGPRNHKSSEAGRSGGFGWPGTTSPPQGAWRRIWRPSRYNRLRRSRTRPTEFRCRPRCSYRQLPPRDSLLGFLCAPLLGGVCGLLSGHASGFGRDRKNDVWLHRENERAPFRHRHSIVLRHGMYADEHRQRRYRRKMRYGLESVLERLDDSIVPVQVKCIRLVCLEKLQEFIPTLAFRPFARLDAQESKRILQAMLGGEDRKLLLQCDHLVYLVGSKALVQLTENVKRSAVMDHPSHR